jgi:hypothetical protein
MKPTPATTNEMAYLTAQVEALRYRLPHPIADMADKLTEKGAL